MGYMSYLSSLPGGRMPGQSRRLEEVRPELRGRGTSADRGGSLVGRNSQDRETWKGIQIHETFLSR